MRRFNWSIRLGSRIPAWPHPLRFRGNVSAYRHVAAFGVIGVGTTTQVAPPSEPGRPISGTRLSSWWLLQRRSANHSMRLF